MHCAGLAKTQANFLIMTKEYIQSPLGLLEIVGNADTIFSINFVDENPESTSYRFMPKEVGRCIEQLDEYFSGNREVFDLNLQERGTEFQRKVWQAISKIPKGKTVSYTQLAKQVGGAEGNVRAVGSACGKNPFLIVVPCHRVLGSGGELTGYAGGIDKKEWLLKFENALNTPKQLSLF